jgi:hypothetical protein
MSMEQTEFKAKIEAYSKAVNNLRSIELKVRGDYNLSDNITAIRAVHDVRDKLKKATYNLLERLLGSAALVESITQAIASSYIKDITHIGFIRTPFVLTLEHEIAKRFADHNWNNLFFPTVISTSAMDIPRLVNWLAESLTGELPEIVRTEKQLLRLLQGSLAKKDRCQPIMLVGFNVFHESLLCAVEAECRQRKIVLMATQEVEFSYDDERYQGLSNWTTKLSVRYRPEAVSKIEIERQSKWKNKNSTDIAKAPELRDWIMDADVWAQGKLPLSNMLAEL